LRAIWVAGNEYLQEAAPWSTFKEDPASAAVQVRVGLNLIRLYGKLSAAFIPDAAASMLAAMNAEGDGWPNDIRAELTALPAGHAFTVPENLFRKITDDERTEWVEKFAGTRD
jgi:methionyl-tRNA synthetase